MFAGDSFLFASAGTVRMAVQPTTPEGKACARLLELAAREPDKAKKAQLDISEKVSPEKAKNLAIALAKDPAFVSFTWLKLNVYLLGEHLAEIAEILTGAKHLESIRFRMYSLVDKNQSIDPDAVLAGQPPVKQPDVSGFAIAKLIQCNQNLKEISIAHCEYKGEALRHILSAVATHKSLTNVNLKTNAIKEHADLIVEAVRKNENITKLSLKKTDLTSDSMLALVEALSSNTNITNLNISDNGGVSASDRLSNALIDLVRKNYRIRLMKLDPGWLGASLKQFETILRPHSDLPPSMPISQIVSISQDGGNIKDPNFNWEISIPGQKLTDLPKEILGSQFTVTLKELYLCNNSFTSLPAGISTFGALRRLQMSSNRISVLPPAYIAPLKNLRELSMCGNEIAELSPFPASLAGSLQYVYLQSNKFKTFPVALTSLRAVVHIDLSFNQISLLPRECAQLSNTLRTLILHSNKLVTVREEVTELTGLQQLILSANPLDHLPVKMANMANLKLLNVDGCPMCTIPEDKRKTPIEIFEALRAIEQTSASYSHVKLMIMGADSLAESNLSLSATLNPKSKSEEKKEKAAEGEVVLIRSDAFEWDRNAPTMMPSPRGSVIQGKDASTAAPGSPAASSTAVAGTTAGAAPTVRSPTIMNSLLGVGGREKDNSNAVHFQVRDFTGMKATIAKKKKDKKKATDEDEAEAKMKRDKEERDRKNLVKATSSFFLTPKAVYLVAFNILVKADLVSMEYWLKAIEARVPKAPVLLVAMLEDKSKASKDTIQPIIAQLKDRYNDKNFPCVIDLFIVDQKSRSGVAELMARVVEVAEKRKLVNLKLNPAYVQLKDKVQALAAELEAQRRPPILTWRDFTELARSFNISVDSPDEAKVTQELYGAISFLTESSQLMYFGREDPTMKDAVILNSEWLVKVIKSVFAVDAEGKVTNGRVRHQDMFDEWTRQNYPPEVHPQLLTVLKQFDALLLLGDQNDTKTDSGKLESLVPALLPDERPESVKKTWLPRRTEEVKHEYVRMYIFKFLPIGFFQRLLLRSLSLENYEIYAAWKNGMLLRDKPTKDEREKVQRIPSLPIMLALFEYNQSMHRLKISVRLMTDRTPAVIDNVRLIWESIDALIGGWFANSLKFVQVACAHCLLEKSYDPEWFKLHELELQVAKGSNYTSCRGTFRQVLIPEMASEIALSDLAQLKIEKFSDIQIEKEIGAGSFAKVYKGVYKGETVAVKRMNFDVATGDQKELVSKFQEFRHEVLLMSSLANHPNLCALRGICTDPFCLVTEFLSEGNLYDLLHKPDLKFDSQLRVKIAMDIAQGMSFLHQCTPPIIHRDLKTPNILMASTRWDAEVCAKVCDFGLSLRMAHSAGGREVGNPVWLAPEIMRKDKLPEYTQKADVYSYGIMLWELLHVGENPFAEYPKLFKFIFQLEEAIVAGTRPTIDKKWDKTPWQILTQECWDGDAKKRPEFKAIVNRLEIIRKTETPLVTVKANNFTPSAPGINTNTTNTNLNTRTAGTNTNTNPNTNTNVNTNTQPPARNYGGDEAEDLAKSKRRPAKGAKDITYAFSNAHNFKASDHGVQVVKYFENPFTMKAEVWICCGPSSIKIYDPATRKEIATLNDCHTKKIQHMLMAAKEVWTASAEPVLKCWSFESRKCVKTIKLKTAGQITAMCAHDDTIWLVQDNKLMEFSASKAKLKREKQFDQFVSALLYLPSTDRLWVGQSRNIAIFDATKLTPKVLLEGHTDIVHDMVIVGDEVWSCSSDKTLRTWTKDGDPGQVPELHGHTSRVFDLETLGSAEEVKLVCSGSWDKTMMVWDAQNGKFSAELHADYWKDAVASIAAIRQAGFIREVWTGSWDGNITVWAINPPMMVTL